MIGEVYHIKVKDGEVSQIEVLQEGNVILEINGNKLDIGDNNGYPGWIRYDYFFYGEMSYFVYQLDFYQFTNYEGDEFKRKYFIYILHEYLISTKRIKKLETILK